MRYFTPAALDMFAFCLNIALRTQRPRIRGDSAAPLPWLRNTAQFTGQFFRKFFAVDMSGILATVIDAVNTASIADMAVLEALVERVGGIELLSSVADEQLEAVTGGEHLRSESILSKKAASKRAAQHFKQALTTSTLTKSSGAALSQLFVRLALMRKQTIFGELSAGLPAHILGSRWDFVQRVLVMYSEFVGSYAASDALTGVPSIDVCISEYKLSPALIFAFARSGMRVHEVLATLREDNGAAATENETTSRNDADGASTVTSAAGVPPVPAEWDVQSEEFAAKVKSTLPETVWRNISPLFYGIFWGSRVNDLFMPTETYQAMITRLTKTKHDKEKELRAAEQRGVSLS